MFSWNRFFLSLFESCLLTCLLALFCFSTRSLLFFSSRSFAFQLVPFFNFLSFACQVCFSVVWLFYFALRHFFIFSVISVLSFANLHINNVICKLFCCFLTTNPDRYFVVICLLFPLSLMSFCVSSFFSVFLFSAFCAFFLSPSFSSPIPFIVFLVFLEYLPLSFSFFSIFSLFLFPLPLPIKHLVLLVFLVLLSLSLPSSSLLCASTRPPVSHV